MNTSQIKSIELKKGRLDAMRPLPQEQLKNLEEWYKVELTYTSNAIEGNTLTRAETAMVVEKGITVKGKTLEEHLEAKNHAVALDYIKDLVHKDRQQITQDDILKIHSLILQGIDDPNAGRYRNVPVRIAGSRVVLPNHMKVPDLMDSFSDWLKEASGEPLIKLAADAHYKLVTIHPFVDGNGRTARLLMNLILMQAGYPPAVIRPEERHEYITSLESAQLGGTLDAFYGVIFDAINSSLDVYLGEEMQAIVEPQVTMVAGKDVVRRSELADISGVRASTIKYYTEMGILPYSQSDEGLSRYYDRVRSLERLQSIERLKMSGLSLDEIKAELGA